MINQKLREAAQMTKNELANFILDEMGKNLGCYVYADDDDCSNVCIDGWFDIEVLAERILEKLK